MPKSPSQALHDEVVKGSVTAVLKPAGFRKKSTRFHRRHGSSQQLVHLQGSAGSHFENYFYINIGVRFDELCAHFGHENDPEPKGMTHTSSSKDSIGGRLERYVDTAPENWVLTADGAPEDFPMRRRDSDIPSDEVPAALRSTIETLLERFDGLESLAQLPDHPWFENCVGWPLEAVSYYVLGDLAHAGEALDGLVASAEKRVAGGDARMAWATDRANWIEKYLLAELA